MTRVYIDDISMEELKGLILSDDALEFKHKDCAMYFTSDGEHLYAHDMDWKKTITEPNNDCFAKGDFSGMINGHYRDYDGVINLMERLEEEGLTLSLSDVLQKHEMSLGNLKHDIAESVS